MTTDIHDLDRHIGRYVSIEQDGEGADGYLVDVLDEVDYMPDPVRWVTLDWGQGFRVGSRTSFTFPDPPEGERPPQITGPVRRMHLAMHSDGMCLTPDICTYEGVAVRALREVRVWRMKQDDRYWKHTYVRPAQAAVRESQAKVRQIAWEATLEGAPQHIQDLLDAAIFRAAKWGEEGPE